MRGAGLLLSLITAACGGTVVEQVGGAAGTASSTTTQTSTVAASATSSSSTGLTCKDLRNEIRGAESRAKICAPRAAEPQCTLPADGLCCHVAFDAANVGWIELHAELMEELRARPECTPSADDCFITCHPDGPGECMWDARGAAQCYP